MLISQRLLPAGQGPNKNVFLRRSSNGPLATSFTIAKKNKAPMPSNWPIMCARTINAQMRLREVPELVPIIDIEAHIPVSLLLHGRHQLITAEGHDRLTASRTNSALLVGVNRYDRWLQSSLGATRKLQVDSFVRGNSLYVRTNLSISNGAHELAVPLLADIPGIRVEHFHRYIHKRHLLGYRVECPRDQDLGQCFCKYNAIDLLPAMWVTR